MRWIKWIQMIIANEKAYYEKELNSFSDKIQKRKEQCSDGYKKQVASL